MEILRFFTEDEVKHRLEKKIKRRRKAAGLSSGLEKIFGSNEKKNFVFICSVAVDEILEDQPADFDLQFRRLGEFRFDAKPKNAVVTIFTETSHYEVNSIFFIATRCFFYQKTFTSHLGPYSQLFVTPLVSVPMVRKMH